MALISVIRRVPGVFVALLAIAGVMVVSQPAHSSTTELGFGAVHVTVTPTTKLADGQAVAVHVEAVPTYPIFDVQVHVCQGGAAVKNGFEFDFDGPYCSPSKLSPAADNAVEKRLAGTSTADLTFHVGVGTGAPWAITDGGTRTLTCGPGNPCDLVVQLAVTNGNMFAEVPLCFGPDCPAEPDPSTPPPPVAAGAASGSGSQGGGAASSAAGASPETGNGQSASGGGNGHGAAGGNRQSNDGAAAATQAPQSGAAGTTGAAGASTSADGTTALAEPAVAVATPTIATWRIVLAGIAGLLCGARIVSVIGRARRKNRLVIA